MTLDSGTTLSGRWELTSRIARGGMGDVYRAHDRRLEREVAIKILRAGVSEGPRRFEREIEMLSQLQHRNIVVLFDVGEHDDQPFLVMKLVDGPSLAEVLADGPLPLDAVRDMGAEIASALAYAHERGIVHRDVKPGNVIFDADGSAHLADFGIAHLADLTGLTATGVTVGTASYVAPEQLSGHARVGPASDVYSLGLVLLEAVTGERAFQGPPTEAAFARLSRQPSVPETFPAGWQRVLHAMTAREAATRPGASEVAGLLAADLPSDRTATLRLPEHGASATTMLDEVDADRPTDVLPADGVPTQGAPASGRAGLARGRWRWAVYLAAALVGLAVLVVLLVPGLTGGPGEEPPLERPETDLPPELDDAFERLLRSVRP